jgi:DNA ligase (NAD+)
MLRAGYDPRIAAGTICSAGTLGQIIPPSVILVLLGDVLGNAYQKAQLAQGVYAPKTVSVGDLFAGAMLPGLVLVGGYLIYLIGVAWLQPQRGGLFRLDREPLLRAKLVGLERWGEKMVSKLFEELQRRRTLPLARFLVALAIPDVGSATARLLALHFHELEALRSAGLEELQHVDGIGPEVAAKIRNWFEEPEHGRLVERLLELGVRIEAPRPPAGGGAFAGKTVVFTGTLEALGRAEAKQLVEEQGGKVGSDVSARTDFLVQGGKPGSKARRAAELGIAVLDEREFLQRIGRA